ncbi:MAG TPA: CHAD domain-containing protein [Pyrinomonadaceae bacterium]|jgi:CHAD domain-containing protein|nr:CHAD domain-containing protein [Pyrinomonadaceae bacterium]
MAKAGDIVGLDCAGEASVAVALVLRARFAEMCALRAAALDWSDPEGVHDMRVASRRLRSAMRDFAPYLAGRLPRKRLRQLARTLGAVRDEDVAIDALEELASTAEPDIEAGLRHLIAERCERREHARALLALALEESALAALQEEFLHKLARATRRSSARARRKRNEMAARSFRRVGREIMLGLLDELLADGNALYRPHAEGRLHRLRIAAKRLRYALELYGPCWGEQLTWATTEVAELQKSLGELHDCDVWLAELGERLRGKLMSAGDDVPETRASLHAERRAATWLLDRFVKERVKHYRAALARWADWTDTNFNARLRADLAPVESTLPPVSMSATSLTTDTDESV